MGIIVSAPDAFFDAEPWLFDLTINQPDGSGPLDLSGSRLFVRFASLVDNLLVGACDSGAGDGSLAILEGPAGSVRFNLTNAGRTWRLPVSMAGALELRATVVGDLYRLPPGPNTVWDAVARIKIDVLPSTGLPLP